MGINSSPGQDLPLGAGGAVDMTIQNGTGHIGIGTKTPGTWLQITGTGGTNIDFATTGRIQTGTDSIGGTGGVWVGPNQFFGSGDASRLGIYNNNWAVTVQNTGAVGIGTTLPQAALDVAGGVKIGTDTGSCTTARAGTLSYSGGNLLICTGTAWKTVGGSNYKIGVTFPGYESQIWCDYYTNCSQTIWPGVLSWDEYMTVTTNANGGYGCTHTQIWCGNCNDSPNCYVSIQKE
jgi:hypothetical protein